MGKYKIFWEGRGWRWEGKGHAGFGEAGHEGQRAGLGKAGSQGHPPRDRKQSRDSPGNTADHPDT